MNNEVIYKCYHQKDAYLKNTLNTDEDTYDKISEEFLKEVLHINKNRIK